MYDSCQSKKETCGIVKIVNHFCSCQFKEWSKDLFEEKIGVCIDIATANNVL